MDKRIGAQGYTIRDYLQTKEDFDESMKKLSDIGYKVVQLSAIGDIDPLDIRKSCDKYNMTIACTHRPYNELKNKTEECIDFHKKIGCHIAGLGAIPNWDAVYTRQQIMNIIAELNEIYDRFNKDGIEFCYHNHAIEFIKIDGKFIMDYMLEYGKFNFIIDVYWLAVSGINPGKFIREHKDRISIIHFKDLKIKNNAPAYCEVMEGNLDWDDIIEAAFESNAEFAVVEQDICESGKPFESLKISYDNLVKKGFI